MLHKYIYFIQIQIFHTNTNDFNTYISLTLQSTAKVLLRLSLRFLTAERQLFSCSMRLFDEAEPDIRLSLQPPFLTAERQPKRTWAKPWEGTFLEIGDRGEMEIVDRGEHGLSLRREPSWSFKFAVLVINC